MKKRLIAAVCVLFWLAVWQVGAMLLGQELLLVSPVRAAGRLLELIPTEGFLRSVAFSSGRILGGFGLGLTCGTLLALLAGKFRFVRTLLAPLVAAVKAVPVASITVLALVWVSSRNLSVLVTFLIALPVVYSNMLESLGSMDPKLTEMAELYHISGWKRFAGVYLSQLLPGFCSAVKLAIGLSWKSGAAAEVIGIPSGSIGEKLYEAKVYLEPAALFAWTIAVILLSWLSEKLFMFLVGLAVRAVSGKNAFRCSKLREPDNSPARLRAEGVTKRFGGISALDGFSAEFQPGSTTAVMGASGCGKTTIATVIANITKSKFVKLNATASGIKEIRDLAKSAKDELQFYQRRTIVFVDEIHRFNKGQQDYLLPFVEDGTIILIGATTENPYFEVNGALLSRSVIFELKPLDQEDIRKLILRAVQDEQKGMGAYNAVIEEDALSFLAQLSGGDARHALNAVELGIMTTERSEDGKIHFTLEVAQECIQKRVLRYDKSGDNHYDTISAFIKSMRGSDPDAAIYYLARMLYAGEDVKFIARRIMILAAEDIGNADPQAIQVAVSAALAVERIGLPEARIILSQAATYVASAPKSNSAVCAISDAMAAVRDTMTAPIPVHLQDAHYKSSQKLGHGIGYKYAHDYPNHYVEQQYLPDEIKDARFYEPGDLGYEKKIKEHLQKLRKQ